MNKLKTIDILISVISPILAIRAIIWYFTPGHVDIIGSTGSQCFHYFTTDSNILMLVTSLIWSIYLIINKEKPVWLYRLKFAATVSVTLTLLVTTFFLGGIAYINGGIRAYLKCFEGNVFYLHFLCPLLSIISLWINDGGYQISFREGLLTLIPSGLYGLVYFLMVVVFKSWPDFYHFTFGGRYWVTPIVVVVNALVVVAIIRCLLKLQKPNK